MAKNNKGQTIAISPERFRGYMDRWGLTNSDVARLFRVQPVTVGCWSKDGIAGLASVAVEAVNRYLEKTNKTAAEFAKELGVELVGFPRKPFNSLRKSKRSEPMPDKTSAAPAKHVPLKPGDMAKMIRGEM